MQADSERNEEIVRKAVAVRDAEHARLAKLQKEARALEESRLVMEAYNTDAHGFKVASRMQGRLNKYTRKQGEKALTVKQVNEQDFSVYRS